MPRAKRYVGRHLDVLSSGMTRTLLAVLMLPFALAACVGAPATYQQATPVPRPWTTTTTYTLPPGQPHAPVGAGAAVERLPSQATTVERSPNRRALPPAKEAGLWAADGAPAASTGDVSLFGVDVPMSAEVAADPSALRRAKQCALDMTFAMKDASVQHLLNYLNATRSCVAASALFYCTTETRKDYERAKRDTTSHRKLEVHLDALIEAWCGTALSPEQKTTLEALEKAWERRTKGSP